VPGRSQKQLLRDAAEPLLPDYVMNHPKQGFCAPVTRWATELLADQASIEDGPLCYAGVLRPDAQARAAAGDSGFAFWTLGTLADWTNRNLGSPVAPPLEPVSS
jgi:asparagine synthase